MPDPFEPHSTVWQVNGYVPRTDKLGTELRAWGEPEMVRSHHHVFTTYEGAMREVEMLNRYPRKYPVIELKRWIPRERRDTNGD